MMDLYIVTNRENVKQRWVEVSTDWDSIDIDAEVISQQSFNDSSCVLVHIDSLSKDQITFISTYWDKVNLIAFSDNPNDIQGIELLLRGFKGYINTFVTESIFAELIKSVRQGDIWAGASIVQKTLKRLLAQTELETNLSLNQYDLSDREKETVEVLVTGASNKEIGRRLGITERTVKAHVSAILRKTDTADRVSLIIKLKDSHG